MGKSRKLLHALNTKNVTLTTQDPKLPSPIVAHGASVRLLHCCRSSARRLVVSRVRSRSFSPLYIVLWQVTLRLPLLNTLSLECPFHCNSWKWVCFHPVGRSHLWDITRNSSHYRCPRWLNILRIWFINFCLAVSFCWLTVFLARSYRYTWTRLQL